METGSDVVEPRIGEYLATVWSRKWVVLAVAAVVVGTSLAFSLPRPDLYRSEARILVRPVLLSPTVTSIPNLESEKQIVASRPVAELASEKLADGTSPGSLQSGLSVEVVPETEVLAVRYTHTERAVTKERAQALSEAYLDLRRDQTLEDLLAASETLTDRIEGLNARLANVKEMRRRADDVAERQALDTESFYLVVQISLLQQKITELTPPDTLRAGQIVQPAGDGVRTGPNHVANGLMALIAGLALGIGAALLLERLEDRLRGRGDLETRAGAPVLAVVPRHSADRRSGVQMATFDGAGHPAAEAYRTLRTSLLFSAARNGAKSILVTSPGAREGKTITAVNLAAALAQAGKRVVLVDADLRNPGVHRFLGPEGRAGRGRNGGNGFDGPNGNMAMEGAGLTGVLTGQSTLEEAVVPTRVRGLHLMVAGAQSPISSELLGSSETKRVIDRLASSFDFVLLDAPPVLPVADALALAPMADAVLLVVDASRTPRGSVADARRQLQQVEANIIGAVLNNMTASRSWDYPYHDRREMRRYAARTS
jgi:polysaccharide biosynthesis transport protein